MYETEDAIVVLLDLAGVDADKTEVHAEPHCSPCAACAASGTARRRTAQLPRAGDPVRSLRAHAALTTGHRHGRGQRELSRWLLEITLPKRLPRQVPITIERVGRRSGRCDESMSGRAAAARAAAQAPSARARAAEHRRGQRHPVAEPVSDRRARRRGR